MLVDFNIHLVSSSDISTVALAMSCSPISTQRVWFSVRHLFLHFWSGAICKGSGPDLSDGSVYIYRILQGMVTKAQTSLKVSWDR